MNLWRVSITVTPDDGRKRVWVHSYGVLAESAQDAKEKALQEWKGAYTSVYVAVEETGIMRGMTYRGARGAGKAV